MPDPERDPACSFCGQRKDLVSRVLGFAGVFACMACLPLAENLMERAEEGRPGATASPDTPRR